MRWTAVSITLYLLLFGCMVLLFAWPWLEVEPLGGEQVDALLPVGNGLTALYVVEVEGREGVIFGWESHNHQKVPIAQALLGMSEAELLTLGTLYGYDTFSQQLPADLANEGAQFIRVVRRRFDADGRYQLTYESLWLRNSEGLFWLKEGVNDISSHWQPPIPYFPSEQMPNGRLSQQTRSEGSQKELTVAFEAVSDVMINGRLFQNCVRQEINFDTTNDRVQSQLFCPEGGLVSSTLLSGERLTLQSNNLIGLLPEGKLPPILSITAVTPPTSLQNAKLEQLSHFPNEIGSSEPSIPPTFVNAELPYFIGAQVAGQMAALPMSGGDPLWTLSLPGTVFGAPQVDEGNGRLYFGVSDKRLYAFTAEGIFLWAVTTKDNVVTKPVVRGDMLLFGSEDGTIYCINQHNGRVMGEVDTNGPVAGSPVLVGESAVFGSDDGGVYAIDTQLCEQQWLYDAGEAVEAALVADGQTLYVVGRGLLVTLDAATGDPIWTQEPEEIHRMRPALLADRLLVPDVFNVLSAFGREDGRLLWTRGSQQFFGAPLAVDEQILLAGEDKRIWLLDGAGNEVQQWDAPPNDIEGSRWVFGAQPAGDGFLFVDDQSQYYWLGEER